MFRRGILMILDGWGLGQVPSSDAIAQANTPYFDQLMRDFPNCKLVTHGTAVGLPDGQMGNSEVGHLNLGAGRIVYQDLALIDKMISEGGFEKNQVLQDLISQTLQNGSCFHLVGLVSDGGVHSHIDHLMKLLEILEGTAISHIYVHAITDGRDTDPNSGLRFLEILEQFLAGKRSKIATVMGRYYAMDRDGRWDRIKKAYDALTEGVGEVFPTATAAIRHAYNRSVTDEFIAPCIIQPNALAKVKPHDTLLCFNFRTDRLRQLTRALTQEDMTQYGMRALPLLCATMTSYDGDFKNVQVLVGKQNLKNTLGEMLARYGLSQYRMAETEKYPHVSFFFSGGREKPFSGEKRLLIPSPKVATYDLQPEMSAYPLTDAALHVLDSQIPDFICLNYANTDMVGHTGNFQAAMKAAESVDACMAKLIPAALRKDYFILVLADHGNADFMINEDGTPNTAHTKNLVPCILVSNRKAIALSDGILADVAPTILSALQLPIPAEMTGNILFSNRILPI